MQYLYSIKDETAGIYYEPLVMDTDDALKRDIAYSLKTLDDVPVKQYPKDFAVYRIGAWDYHTGKLMPADHERICCIADLMLKEDD